MILNYIISIYTSNKDTTKQLLIYWNIYIYIYICVCVCVCQEHRKKKSEKPLLVPIFLGDFHFSP